MSGVVLLLARLLAVVVLSNGALALAQTPAEPVRLELVPRADLSVGSTTFVAHDVSQWVCLQTMPSSIVVPVNAQLSDRAETTREPAGVDVSEWFELAGVDGADGIDIALERVDQVWDVTPVGAGGIAFRVFCRVVLAMTPADDADASGAAKRSMTAEVTLRNLGGHTFALNFPLRIASDR